ncbi:hypothetical protein DFH09DRAFT_1420868 [Mycena vulgaris]|nr:hypothetical protein DFH09DRAFT_1420868 [Mycena vulgaris]
MSFEPRRPRARSPPPVYENPPEYTAAVDLSSSPPMAPLRLASPSLSEMEEQAFGHRITHSFTPSYSFDPGPAFPPFPTRHESVQNDMSSTQHQFDFTFPDSTMMETPGDPLPEGTQSVFPVVPKVKATRAKRKPAPARTPTPDSDPEPSRPIPFEILIHTYPLPKKPSARSNRKKAPKAEPTAIGPVDGHVDMNYTQLLEALADAMETEPVFLPSASMEWRWLKPANSAFLPLRSQAGLTSLLKQICTPPSRNVSSKYIIIKMNEPVKRPATQHMPWSASGSGASSQAFDPAAGADEDDSGDGGAKPKVSFDDGLEEEMERIADKYPAGVCALHPTISCFHNRLNDLHFALDRNKRIVWAAAIAAVAVPQPPPTPAGPPAPPQPQFWPNTNGFPYAPYPPPPPPMGYPSPYQSYPHPQYGHPAIPAWQGTPRRSRRDRSWERSSPPQQSSSKRVRREQSTDPQSSPAVSGGSIDEFISRYPTLPAGTKACLVENGFEIGDDLSTLSAEQWKAADIPFFAAGRIIKYYNKYKASLR